jgi:formyl-CoA transferase
MVVPINDPNFGEVLHPGIVPVVSGFDRTAAIRWPGPEVGAHTNEVLEHLLGFSPDRISGLKQSGVV